MHTFPSEKRRTLKPGVEKKRLSGSDPTQDAVERDAPAAVHLRPRFTGSEEQEELVAPSESAFVLDISVWCSAIHPPSLSLVDVLLNGLSIWAF